MNLKSLRRVAIKPIRYTLWQRRDKPNLGVITDKNSSTENRLSPLHLGSVRNPLRSLSTKGPSSLSEATNINSILISNSSQTPKKPLWLLLWITFILLYGITIKTRVLNSSKKRRNSGTTTRRGMNAQRFAEN